MGNVCARTHVFLLILLLVAVFFAMVLPAFATFDSFQDSYGLLLSTHIPDGGGGGAWVLRAGEWQIQNSRAIAIGTVPATGFIATTNTNTPDHTITAWVLPGAGIVTRYNPTNNQHILVRVNPTQLLIRRWDGSAYTTLSTAAISLNPANLVLLTVHSTGSTITATVGNTSLSVTVSDMGMHAGLSAAAAGVFADDFEITTVTPSSTPTSTPTITPTPSHTPTVTLTPSTTPQTYIVPLADGRAGRLVMRANVGEIVGAAGLLLLTALAAFRLIRQMARDGSL